MPNGWTGGQYSLLRVVMGGALAIWFSSAPPAVFGLGALCSLLLAVGAFDRAAALALAALVLWGGSAEVREPARLAIVLALVIHAALPAAAYGSWKARGRLDPGGGFTFPPALFAMAWVGLSVLYAADALGAWPAAAPAGRVVLLVEPLFGPLALVRRLRPWAWLLMLGLQLGLIVCVDGSHLRWGFLLLQLVTFDPAWVPRRGRGAVETLFYDGNCGLCHRAVRFVLAEDADGAAFRFAPLDSDALRARTSEAERAALPDSLVLAAADARLLTRSAGVRHLLARLGGVWRAIAIAAAVVPQGLRDAAYDGVARVRLRLFRKPSDACPVLPPHLRARFPA